MNHNESVSQYLINQTINHNNKVMDAYILDVKQDEDLSFEQQKILIADAMKIKQEYANLNQELTSLLKEINFVSLDNLMERLEQQV